MSTELDAALLDAHTRHDRAALVTLYAKAADATTELDASCFYLTHAYVFALDAGDARAEFLRARLVSHGREE